MSKKDDWFKDRHWRVCTEMNGEREVDGATVHYSGGHFRIDPPHTFRTPLGHPGREGVMVQEVDADGQDIPGSRATFGEAALRSAIEAYGPETIVGLT